MIINIQPSYYCTQLINHKFLFEALQLCYLPRRLSATNASVSQRAANFIRFLHLWSFCQSHPIITSPPIFIGVCVRVILPTATDAIHVLTEHFYSFSAQGCIWFYVSDCAASQPADIDQRLLSPPGELGDASVSRS